MRHKQHSIWELIEILYFAVSLFYAFLLYIRFDYLKPASGWCGGIEINESKANKWKSYGQYKPKTTPERGGIAVAS